MAAGQGFKTFTTGEVLTAADVNGYLMQGVGVFASSTERDAEITSPQEGQFAYLKDTNVTTYYTGSAWANLDTTGMTNPMTTTGDTIYSSSGSTPARLGIGSTGQVLTVAGGVPTWSTPSSGGGYTLLSTTSISGSTTTVSGISGSYKHLYIFVENAYQASSSSAATYTLNGESSTLLQWRLQFSGTTVTGAGSEPSAFDLGTLYASAGKALAAEIFIPRYSETSTRKEHFMRTMSSDGGTFKALWANNSVDITAAITSFTISAGASFSAGTIYIYGVS